MTFGTRHAACRVRFVTLSGGEGCQVGLHGGAHGAAIVEQPLNLQAVPERHDHRSRDVRVVAGDDRAAGLPRPQLGGDHREKVGVALHEERVRGVVGVGGLGGQRHEEPDQPVGLAVPSHGVPQRLEHPVLRQVGGEHDVVLSVALLENRGQQRLLRVEVVQYAGLAQPDALGDLAQRPPTETLLREHLERSVEDLLPAGGGLGVRPANGTLLAHANHSRARPDENLDIARFSF